MKKIICPGCLEESTIFEWNKETNNFRKKYFLYRDEGSALSEKNFNTFGKCIKDNANPDKVTYYNCPKCHNEFKASDLRAVNSSRLVCPKCGSRDLYFVTTTSAQFEALPNGEMGSVILDQDGIDCISQCASLEKENVEISCRNCDSNFNVEYSDNSKWRYKIGDEI